MIVENSLGMEWSSGRLHQQRPPEIDRLQIKFIVSLNEEHVTLSLSNGHCAIDLGERTHHYSLLVLARQRLRDAERGLDLSSQGWIEADQLSHSLGIDTSHLNIHIFRARNQFKQALYLLDSKHELIERRRCELRFGLFSFQIIRGSTMEGKFIPSQFGAVALG